MHCKRVKTDRNGLSELTVYDVFGNQMTPPIRFQNSVEIDASNWASGVYLVDFGLVGQRGDKVKLVKL